MKTKEMSDSYLSFKLDGEVFAAHVGKVLNILEMQRIMKVPRSPDYMLGVINLRGSVLPVVDTRIKFGIEATEFTKNTCIIVLELNMDGQEIFAGAVVDSVQEVLDISDDQIDPPPSIGNKYRSEFIRGMGKVDEEFIMILDIDKIFSSDELTILSQATEKSGEKEQEVTKQVQE